MAMSKRDFEVVAETIRDADTFDGTGDRAEFAVVMANALATTNPRFDRDRFVKACQPTWMVGTTKESLWDRTVRTLTGS